MYSALLIIQTHLVFGRPQTFGTGLGEDTLPSNAAQYLQYGALAYAISVAL